MEYDRLLNLSTEIGYGLLESGAEIYRVEESIQRILLAYGLTTGEVFAIPNCITVSLVTPEGKALTRVRRMPTHGTDIDLLELYNDLCRHLCVETPSMDEAEARCGAIRGRRRAYPFWVELGAYFLGAAFFTLFFGGTVLDALCGGLCGLSIALCLTFLTRLRTNLFFKTVAGGAVSALLALGLSLIGLGKNVDFITIGALMLLVPGRIGTSSPELGVPVVYAEISQFSAICEVAYGKAGYHPDLSYGSHMFQDMVEADVYYGAINDNSKTRLYRPELLTRYPEVLKDILPGESQELADIVKIHDVSRSGATLTLDAQEGRAVCRIRGEQQTAER